MVSKFDRAAVPYAVVVFSGPDQTTVEEAAAAIRKGGVWSGDVEIVTSKERAAELAVAVEAKVDAPVKPEDFVCFTATAPIGGKWCLLVVTNDPKVPVKAGDMLGYVGNTGNASSAASARRASGSGSRAGSGAVRTRRMACWR